MTEREWKALNEMADIKVWVDGYGVVDVGQISTQISTTSPTMMVRYCTNGDVFHRLFECDTELIANNRDLLRATYDKYLSIKHELV